MWDESKLLLLAAVLTLKGTAEGAKVLDLAPNAVGALYSGCREKAWEMFIDSGLLKQELNQSEEFQKAWSANGKCKHVIPGRRQEHTTALSAYASEDHEFARGFDDAVQTLGTNESTYDKDFQFKALNFLLMDSMTDDECKTVYYLTEDYTATKGSNVSFGRFIVAYSIYSELRDSTDWEGVVFFNITSCLFVELGQNICSEDKFVLLSPSEVFTVEDVGKTTDENQAEYTVINLKTRGKMDSQQACDIFSRSPADVSTQWLVLLPVALSLSSLAFFT